MKTKKLPTSTRSGEVKTVNAVAAIHKIFDEIAPNGRMDCQMENYPDEATFLFITNEACVTFHVQQFQPIQEGGAK